MKVARPVRGGAVGKGLSRKHLAGRLLYRHRVLGYEPMFYGTIDGATEPDTRTIRSWIEKGELIGRVVGKLYYVDLDRWETNTGDPLVDKVLRNGAT